MGFPAILLVNGCGDEPSPKTSKPAMATPVVLAILPTVAPVSVSWTTYSDNDLHFSFDSPITLDVNKPPVGLLVKTVDLQGQNAEGDFNLRVQAQEVKYALDLSQEIDKQINALKTMGEALRNLQVATNPVTMGNAPGFLAEGTAHLPGQVPWEMKLLKVQKDSTLLDMLIQYSPTEEGRAAANRVLQSLSFPN